MSVTFWGCGWVLIKEKSEACHLSLLPRSFPGLSSDLGDLSPPTQLLQVTEKTKLVYIQQLITQLVEEKPK